MGMVLGASALQAQQTVYNAASRQDPLGTAGETARAAGLGSAFVGVADDATALLWNPAGLSSLNSPQLFLHHASWLAQTFQEVLVFGIPVPKFGTFALSGTYMGYGSFEGRDASGFPLASLNASQVGAGMGWGKQVLGDLSVGFGLHGTQQNFANYSYFLMGVDGGAFLRTPTGWGVGLSYEGQGLGDSSVKLASNFRLGFSKLFKIKGGTSLLATASGEWEPQGGTFLQAGLEAGFHSILFVRAGYDLALQDVGYSGLNGLAAGIGLVLDSIHLDYAFVPYGELGNTHLISLGYSFGEIQTAAPASKPAMALKAPLAPAAPTTVYVPQAPVIPQTAPQVAPQPVPAEPAKQERTITMEFEVPAEDALVHAKALAQAGKWNEAIQALRDILTKNSQDAAAWRELGNLYYHLNRKDYAVYSYGQYLKLKPADQALADWLERYKAK